MLRDRVGVQRLARGGVARGREEPPSDDGQDLRPEPLWGVPRDAPPFADAPDGGFRGDVRVGGALVREQVVRPVRRQPRGEPAVEARPPGNTHVVRLRELKDGPVALGLVPEVVEVVRGDDQERVQPERADELKKPRPAEALAPRDVELDP